MNIQEQVARLDALLTRIQHNGALLRKERGLGESASHAPSTPAETPRTVALHGTPTQLLPTSVEASAAMRTAVPPKPSSIPAAAPTLIPASGEPLETDFDGPELTTDGFGREESAELTKPLFVGLGGPGLGGAGPSQSQGHPPTAATLPPEAPPSDAFAPIAAATGPSLPPLPEETQEPGPHGFEPVALDGDSTPPLSGERPSSRAPSAAPHDASMSLEEPLASAVGAHIPVASPGFDSDPAAAAASTTSLDTDPGFVGDRDSRISDAPASALGAIIHLPEEDVAVELELAEPPPSSLRTIAPGHPPSEDELEAELPRTSYRAGYDDSLSAPPAAREELIAHDLNARERISSTPSAATYTAEASLTEATRPAPSTRLADDLPPVLSSRPQSPVTIPPQSAVEPLRTAAEREEVTTFDAPYEATPQRAFDEPLPDEPRASVPPYQTAVSDVVVSARPAPAAVEFAPQAHAVAATFEGAVPRAKDASFLELLDTSLSLTLRG